MKSKSGLVIVCLAIVALSLIAFNKHAPDAVTFKALTRESFFGTLSWLFVVALFIERAVEVIVSVLRDSDATTLENKVDAEQQKILEQAKVTPGALAYLNGLHDAQQKLSDYRSETQGLALTVSFVLSLFVSLAGVRAFETIVDKIPSENWLLPTADMIVTGAILAGGTAGIHKMANVYDNFMEAAADKAKAAGDKAKKS
jgi:hypothetical protein